MHTDTVVALVSALVAAIAIVSVPWMAFQFALRQDQSRWLREQRAQFYVDLLTEADAEQRYLEWATADPETRESAREYFAANDVRLSPMDRARLGARGTIFASQAVNVLFNRMQGEGGRALLIGKPDEAQRLATRIRVGAIFDELQTAIRAELGADRIPVTPSPPSRPAG